MAAGLVGRSVARGLVLGSLFLAVSAFTVRGGPQPAPRWERIRPVGPAFAQPSSQIAAVGATGSTWLAVGTVTDPNGARTPTVWASPDGKAWKRSALPVASGTQAEPFALATGGGRAVAAGRRSGSGSQQRELAVWTSADGVTWTTSAAPVVAPADDASATSVAAGEKGLLLAGTAVTPSGRVPALWWSADGAAWSRVGEPAFTADDIVAEVAAGSGGFVAVGQQTSSAGADGAIWFSADGQAWQRLELDRALFGGPGDQAVRTVRPRAAGFLAAGHDGRVATAKVPVVWQSADGRTWSRQPRPDVFGLRPGEVNNVGASIAALAEGPPIVAAGSGTSVELWISSTGQNWSRADLPDGLRRLRAQDPSIATRAGSMLVAADSSLWFSAGGQWTEVGKGDEFPRPAPSALVTAAVAVGEQVVVFLRIDGDPASTQALRSADGRVWTPVADNTPFNRAWVSEATVWKGGAVAVGWTGPSQEGVAFTSTDGTHWERRDRQPGWTGLSAVLLEGVAAGGPGLVAVGYSFDTSGSSIDGHAWVSTDGRAWSPVDSANWGGPGDQPLLAVCPVKGGVVAVGYRTEGPSRQATAFVSPDATYWTRVGGEGAASLIGPGVTSAGLCASTPAGVIAVGSESPGDRPGVAAWTSVDGFTWTKTLGDADRSSRASGAWAVAVRDSRVVVAGYDGDDVGVWESRDAGRTWRQLRDPLLGGPGTQVGRSVAITASGVVVGGRDGASAALWFLPDTPS